MRKDIWEVYLPISDKDAEVEVTIFENNAELKEYMAKTGESRHYSWGPKEIWYSPEQMDHWTDGEWIIINHEELNDTIFTFM